MLPQDPQSELGALLALVDAIRLRVQAELDAHAGAGMTTPLLRSCLTRARGHLELAQRALTETRADGSTLQRGLTLRVPKAHAAGLATPPGEAPGQGASDGSSGWVLDRVDEIGRALDHALGGMFDETPREPARPATRRVVHLEAVEGQDGELHVGAVCPAPQAPPHFSGSTDVLSIPDLIGFFQVQAKSGVLEIEHPSENFRLEFEGGALLHAASTNSPKGERLGEILVRRGAITEAQLASFLANLTRGERLGTALLRLDGVTEAELMKAIEEQVLGIFVRLAKLPGCRFTFREGKVAQDLSGRVRHNVTRLLLDSARRLDEAGKQQDPLGPLGPLESLHRESA